MHFGYIAPIEYLHLIPNSAKFHLILAHLLTNKKYVNYYNDRYDKGDYILLDNSAFEFGRPIEADELLSIIDDSGIKINGIVAPDYPNQPSQITIDSALEFIDIIKHHKRNYDIMAVPQSPEGDVDSWLDCYVKFIHNPDISIIGMSILGIPNAFCSQTGTKDISHNRLYATSFISNATPAAFENKWHHYLGLGSNAREMQIIKQYNFKQLTNDSSSPIWHGYQNIYYDESGNGLINGKSKVPVDFHVPYTPSVVNAIIHNIEWMAGIVR